MTSARQRPAWPVHAIAPTSSPRDTTVAPIASSCSCTQGLSSPVEGLTDATSEALADIEVSPTGLGLHWPQLDADLYVPALLQG
ncbi:DUF2442 domain-containing protein [Halomonas litopenaei]|uniref:DUF2442 domain-containing protein n=1 Tax=Halomonas litopenaei TaxID=2109328 RepID=UPI003FA09B22